MTTAKDLINDTGSKARVLSPSENFSDAVAKRILRELNRMMGTWANNNLLIYEQKEENFSLVASQAEYSIGENGTPDFDTVRPQEILEGTFVRVGSLDYPLKIKSLEEYRNLSLKSTENTPEWLAYNPTYPNGTIYLFYTPNDTDTIYLVSLKALTAFSALTTTVTLPPGYEDAIVYNLALRIGPDFGKTIRQDIINFASDALNKIKLRNSRRLVKPAQTEAGQMFGGRQRSGEEIMATGPYY